MKAKNSSKNSPKKPLKRPTWRYETLPDGSKHIVIDLGYKTNSVELVREGRGK